jgi:very-short-patch-repair endonuclease
MASTAANGETVLPARRFVSMIGIANDGREARVEGDGPKASRSRRRPGATERARALRNGDNLAEGKLWSELKDRRLGGYKFVRQHPIGPYFADFACREKRLVVELDGSQHAESERDRRRDAFMQEAGWSVIRFWSHEARTQTRAVCETILAALAEEFDGEVVAGDLRYVPGKREDGVKGRG